MAAPLIWAAVSIAVVAPIWLAAASPFLASRGGAYIVGGFAGIVCLALFVIQPMLAAGYLPGLRAASGLRWHRLVGVAIVAAVVLHVGGLYATSPMDATDALLLRSPTPFSVYGVIALWGVALTAVLVALRRRLGLSPSGWRVAHNGLAFVVVVATVVHALQIEGAMEPVSKWVLCILALVATSVALFDLRVIRPMSRRRAGASGGPRG